MGSCSDKLDNYNVIVRRKEVVAAALPLQEHWLPLSNLDLLLPAVDVSVYFCYKKQSALSFASAIRLLKRSLAQTLVSFYAFAGEMDANGLREPELRCNNRGVDFIEAVASVELKDLPFHNPDVSVHEKLVPKRKAGVLCVQVTELKCSGIVVACTFDHRVADAYSANLFLVAWAEAAQSKPITLHPCFRRSLLNPRYPPSSDPSIFQTFIPLSMLPPPPPSPSSPSPLLTRIYYVSTQDIAQLQLKASTSLISFTKHNQNGNKTTNCHEPHFSRRTKLESFIAYLWQIIARSETAGTKCKMGIVVDGRTRLFDSANNMASYFGNVLSIPFREELAEELAQQPLSKVAEVVHNCVLGAANKEHFLGMIDWVEAQRPKPTMARVYYTEKGSTAVVVSSGLRLPMREVEFGWGKAVFRSYEMRWGGDCGYVMPMESGRKEGDWVVYMRLKKRHVEALEMEAGHVFRPLTMDYLDLA